MDSTAGEFNHAAKEIDANTEKQLSSSSSDETSSRDDVVGEKQEQEPHSSGSSSEDVAQLKRLDSHIVKVPEVNKDEEAYAHLPEYEKDIVKKQLDIPSVSVTYKTLYRYATKNDIIIIVISALCAIAGGAALPLMTVGIFKFYL